MKTVGIITIHGINNFGSLLQSYATQIIVERLGFKPQIINYQYPNEYHLNEIKKKSPYASFNPTLWERIRISLYNRTVAKRIQSIKRELFKKSQKELLYLTKEYANQEILKDTPPVFDIYLTGSDQVWNPRYMYNDCTFLLDFITNVPKVAFSASFGSTNIQEKYKTIYKPLLNEYCAISLREKSGVGLIKDICEKDSVCTCDPTLLLTGDEWADIFDDKPLIQGEYILCYILTYTANPYPYAGRFIKHIQKHLKKKVVILDENGMYWMDFRYKSFQCYGPREIVNLFKNASFIISSSFHGAAFSVNFKKDFYSIFPPGVKDERQEGLLKIIGAEDRFIRVGTPLPSPQSFKIQDWNRISANLDRYRQESINYLSKALNHAAQLTK